MESVSSISGGSWFVYSLLNGWIENNKYNEYVNKIKDNKEIQKMINVFKNLKISDIFLDEFSNNIEKIKSIQWNDFVDTYVNKIFDKKNKTLNIKWFKMSAISSSGIYGPKTYYDLNQEKFLFPLMESYIDNKIEVEILNIENSEFSLYKDGKEHNQKFDIQVFKEILKTNISEKNLLGIDGDSAVAGILSCVNKFKKKENKKQSDKDIISVFKGLYKNINKKRKMNKTQKNIFKRILYIISKYSKKFIINTLSYIYNIFVKIESGIIEETEKILINRLIELDLNNVSINIPYYNEIDNRINSGINVIDGGYLDNTAIITCIYHNQEKYKNIYINSFIDVNQQKKDLSFWEEGNLNDGVWFESLDIDYDKTKTKIWETTKKEEGKIYKKNNVSIQLVKIEGKTVNNDFFNIKGGLQISINFYFYEFIITNSLSDLVNPISSLENDIITPNNYKKYIKNLEDMKSILNDKKDIINSFF